MCPNTEQVGCSLQGVLAQAKNGDQVFWEEKFHAANGKAQACTQGALFLFLFCFGGEGRGGEGGGGEFFFIFRSFPICLHYVPFKFPICSPIRNIFPFFIPPHFYPICLGNGVLLSPI